MYGARSFTYDGKSSWDNFGLLIADFDNNSVKESEAYTVDVKLDKAPGMIRFYNCGADLPIPPTCEFTVISEEEISPEKRSEFLSLVCGRKQFKDLRFYGGDHEDYVYRCIFTSAKIIWVNGRCFGFKLTAQFDSIYARKADLNTYKMQNGKSPLVMNDSDILDDYVYPMVVIDSVAEGHIQLSNWTDVDDFETIFRFDNLKDGLITVDNETRCVFAADKEILSKFNKTWLRLFPGRNTIYYEGNCEVTISFPTYKLIGY